MKRYGIDELRAALEALDGRLKAPATLTLIGGSAVALLLDDRELATKDIDAFEVPRAVRDAARKLAIVLDAAAVADLPWHFEDRCVPVLRFHHLAVRVPEAHDLVLSKILRWSEGDEDHVRRLHARRPIAYETLLTRYMTEMNHAIGDPARRRSHFLWCIELLFGEVAAARAARRIDAG